MLPHTSLILTTVLLTQKCGLSVVSHILVICMVLGGLLQARAEFCTDSRTGELSQVSPQLAEKLPACMACWVFLL